MRQKWRVRRAALGVRASSPAGSGMRLEARSCCGCAGAYSAVSGASSLNCLNREGFSAIRRIVVLPGFRSAPQHEARCARNLACGARLPSSQSDAAQPRPHVPLRTPCIRDALGADGNQQRDRGEHTDHEQESDHLRLLGGGCVVSRGARRTRRPGICCSPRGRTPSPGRVPGPPGCRAAAGTPRGQPKSPGFRLDLNARHPVRL